MQEIGNQDKNTPTLTVIVATYNRAYILAECLDSLATQTAFQATFEVIVVDNNSTDNTEAVVDLFYDKILGLRFVKESRQGLSYARNTGMSIAKAEWIACLDSDAKAHANWIEIILAEISKDNFDCFGGPYLAWHRTGPPPIWFANDWESTTLDYNFYGVISENNFPTGGNCAFKKQLALTMGKFPVNIGMQGGKCGYGEETKLFVHMCEAGARIGSVPDMLIDHCVLPYKYTLRWRLYSAYAHGRDAPFVFQEFGTWRRLPRNIGRVGKRLVRAPFILAQGCRKGYHWQRLLLDCGEPILSAIGVLKTSILLLVRQVIKKKRQTTAMK